MTTAPRIAVIGGSREGGEICRVLEAAGLRLAAYVPKFADVYRPQGTQALEPLETLGGRLAGYDCILCAAHPFDVPSIFPLLPEGKRLAVVRPPWLPKYLERWLTVPDSAAAARAVTERGFRHVLVTTGAERLKPFLTLPNTEVTVRTRRPHHPPLTAPLIGRVLCSPGPFSVEGEKALLAENGIDAVVTHNAGGPGGRPKLDAAFELGLPVVMIARPVFDGSPQVHSVADAIVWLNRRFGLDLPTDAA